ncbi:MAG: rhomboid family intramembrane serine protease [Clostridia bacterium]|nr:rhomboid family intramembrane serine protease [Clostridia bacterium]
MQKLINSLERKLYRYRIPPIMKYIIYAMAGVFVLDLLFASSTAYSYRFSLISHLMLSTNAILHGQIWRLVTWIFIPDSSSMLWLLLSLYFYFMVGTTLENRWGTRRFLIYLVIGAVANIIGAFVAHLLCGYGIGTNAYLFYSLFLAFAALYPDAEFLLFFVLPVKAKWLALIDLLYFLSAIFFGGLQMRCAAIASLVNVMLFFGDDLYRLCRRTIDQFNRRRSFHNYR